MSEYAKEMKNKFSDTFNSIDLLKKAMDFASGLIKPTRICLSLLELDFWLRLLMKNKEIKKKYYHKTFKNDK